MRTDKQIPSGRDKEMELKILFYLKEKPSTKTTVSSREIYKKFDLDNRRAADTLELMSRKGIGPIGEKIEENRQARWKLNNE